MIRFIPSLVLATAVAACAPSMSQQSAEHEKLLHRAPTATVIDLSRPRPHPAVQDEFYGAYWPENLASDNWCFRVSMRASPETAIHSEFTLRAFHDNDTLTTPVFEQHQSKVILLGHTAVIDRLGDEKPMTFDYAENRRSGGDSAEMNDFGKGSSSWGGDNHGGDNPKNGEDHQLETREVSLVQVCFAPAPNTADWQLMMLERGHPTRLLPQATYGLWRVARQVPHL